MKITVIGNFVDILNDNGSAHSMTLEQFQFHARDDAMLCNIAQKCTRSERESVREILPDERDKVLDDAVALIEGVKT